MTALAPQASAMRCNTPIKRSVSQLRATSSPWASQRTNGLKFNNTPMAKMSTVRLATLRQKAAVLPLCKPGMASASALPTANKKKGKTRSVGVQPCHGACAKGGNKAVQLPGLLTKIIKATAAPRSTSSEVLRVLALGVPVLRVQVLRALMAALAVMSCWKSWL